MLRLIALCMLFSTVAMASEKENLKFEAKIVAKRKLIIMIKRENQLDRNFDISNEIDQETLKKITEKAREFEQGSSKFKKMKKNRKIGNTKV